VARVDLREDEPHPARVYDYLLGGKDNYAADREVGQKMMKASPGLRATALAHRRFMVRSARYLAAEVGLRQFLDIGTGLPTSPNLHEVVQAIAPECRVVYVDNDPMVLVNARALLVGAEAGSTGYLHADLRDPGSILARAEREHLLDLSRPVAVSLVAILHFIVDEAESLRIVHELMAAVPSGSALTISAITADGAPAEIAGVLGAATDRGIASRPRPLAEVEALFAGLDLLDPGVVRVNRWRPELDGDGDPNGATPPNGDGEPGLAGRDASVYAGVAIKP
jgi:S-adenosyl methyltransferase